MYALENIAIAAGNKFGEIIEAKRKDSNGLITTYKLLIRRDSCPFADRPYMTITASENPDANPSVSFFWGHYDLTLEAAQKYIAEA